ncbi:MAG TPA: hypothetical protein VLD62_06640 [Acidimicrobiia bacterium]|nr:hypothetical protein [Acidimicrobiia bacterium]
MKRILPLLALIGFLVYTGIYIVVYLVRAFRIGDPVPGEVVQVWHGDPFMRSILVTTLFVLGLLVLIGYVEIMRVARRSGRGVKVRADLWDWIAERSDDTGEPIDEIVDRAVAAYRDRLESTRV